jgi:hypothetical protein
VRRKQPEPEGFSVWVRNAIKDHNGKFLAWQWIARTNPKGDHDLEFARAFTGDLNEMGCVWQIRNKRGEVVEQSAVQ